MALPHLVRIVIMKSVFVMGWSAPTLVYYDAASNAVDDDLSVALLLGQRIFAPDHFGP